MNNKLLNSFSTKIIAKMYLQSELADIHFTFPSMGAPSEKVLAHKNLLAMASPVFKAMFYGPLKETDTVEITDSNASAFKEFLQVIYLPENTLTIGNIEEIVRLADKYDMLDCFDTCAEFLEANLTSDNMVWGYQLAITLNNAQLKTFCEQHIQNCVAEILKSEMFLHCGRDLIERILKMDGLECDEAVLFNACMEWAKVSCQKNGLDEIDSENLKNQLGTCFSLIRFGAMETEKIGAIFLNDVFEGMFTRNELKDIILSKWTKQSKSELFNHQPRLKPSLKWNTANKLEAERDSQPVQQYVIQPEESTWFSTNKLVLLREISFASIQNNSGYYNAYGNFQINIVEHNKDDFQTNGSTKILYTKSNIQINNAFKLPAAIAVKPHKMYEIRLTPSDMRYDYYKSSAWVNNLSSKKLDDKIIITFHQHPSDNDGLVSTLYFNRIE